ncbi:MAG: ABC transporter permease [Myxococcales bacterium]
MLPLRYSWRSLTVRWATTLSTAAGIALVVFVFSAVLMLGAGIRATLASSGHGNLALVLRKGSETEITSLIDLHALPLLESLPEVARRSDGRPDVLAEAVSVLDLERPDGQGIANVQVRGVPDDVFEMRPEVQLVAGHKARPGSTECIIGRSIRGRLPGLELGQRLELNAERTLQVVGIFASEGSSFESEVWADAPLVRGVFGSEGYAQSVRVSLRAPGLLPAFAKELEQRRLDLSVELESDYYERQSDGTAGFIVAMGIAVAVLFVLAAVLGAMITMYAAVSKRRRENRCAAGAGLWSVEHHGGVLAGDHPAVARGRRRRHVDLARARLRHVLGGERELAGDRVCAAAHATGCVSLPLRGGTRRDARWSLAGLACLAPAGLACAARLKPLHALARHGEGALIAG